MFDARPNLASTSNGKPNIIPKGPPSHQHPHHPSSLNAPNPTSSHQTLLSNLRTHLSMDRLCQFRDQRLGNMRPWIGEFFSRDQFNVPQGVGAVQSRLFSNLGYFQSNYLVILLLLFVYCVIQHVMLAFMVVGLVAGYLYCKSLPDDFARTAVGMTFTKHHIQVSLVIFGLLMLFLTNIGSAFFWLLGLSVLVIGSHAAFHEVSLESDFGQRV